jgi:capsid protein
MIITDYEKYIAEGEAQIRKQSRAEPRLVPVDRSAHPPVSGDSKFHAQIESYGPAGYGAVWQDGSKFENGITVSGSGNVYDHPRLLQNSRTAYIESLSARSLVRRYADTVVDKGLRLLPAPKFDILGITAEQAKQWSDNVGRRFDVWFSDKRCSRDEVNNGYQNQRLVELMIRRDGEYFIRFHYSTRKDLLNPLQFQIVDPTQILGYGITDTYGLNHGYGITGTYGLNQSCADGIERDLGGREIAYHVMVLTAKGYASKRIPAIGPRSGRRFFLHGYQPEYPGQGRGLSELSNKIQEYANITDFSTAQVMKAISQSQFNFKTKPGKDAPASDPLEGQAHIYENTYRPPTADPETGELPKMFYTELKEYTARVPGATAIFGLKAGEDFEAIENSAPVEQFASFVEAFNTYLSASSSMPIEVQTMKFGRSYTASMGALILFWRVAEIGRAEQKSDWLDYVYEAWLAGEIAAGRVSAPGWQDPLMRAAWLHSIWGGAPMPIIDPAKQSKADKDYVEMGAHHLDDVARNHNGSDGALNRAELKTQIPELTPVPWGKGGSGGVGNPVDETESDEED